MLIVALSWSAIPLRTGFGSPDPALVFANHNRPASEMWKESYFSHNGLNLHYIEAGEPSAETVLFVHGFPQFWYSFHHQIRGLSEHYRVIAIDGLGAGLSDAPSNINAYKLDNMAKHIAALLTQLKVKKVHLVGHDWGGALVFGFAQKYPQQISSVTSISAPPQNIMLELLRKSSHQRSASDYVEKLKAANPLLLKLLRAPAKLWTNLYLPLVENGKISLEQGRLMLNATGKVKRFDAHINWYRANFPKPDDIKESDYWPSQYATLQVPAMLIWGSEDRVFDESFIQDLERSSRRLTVLRMDGVGHSPHLEQAEKVTTAINDFIKESN